jgi:hypothetical protein
LVEVLELGEGDFLLGCPTQGFETCGVYDIEVVPFLDQDIGQSDVQLEELVSDSFVFTRLDVLERVLVQKVVDFMYNMWEFDFLLSSKEVQVGGLEEC